ncbi:hypothetical protein AB6806_23730 [Bosea sp. RCC_152_1]|uniref:hypothetical protein n=1 Tax=Bosea sp. RCC_152_1 TaxID=3239228 RepID=UPI003525E859
MAKFALGQTVLLATLGAPVECTVIRVFPVSRKTGRQPYALRAKAGYTVGACESELTAAPPAFKFEIGEYALINENGRRYQDTLVRIEGRQVGPVTGRLLYSVEVIEGEPTMVRNKTFPESFLDVAA